jgi:hypothetical protein
VFVVGLKKISWGTRLGPALFDVFVKFVSTVVSTSSIVLVVFLKTNDLQS